MRGIVLASALSVALLLVSSSSRADEPNPEALQHFTQGRRLLDANRCPEARVELRTSIAIEPSIGAYYNFGLCSEKVGEPGEAFVAYSSALALAKERHDEREREIRAQLAEFLDRTPHVRLVFTQPIPAGIRIAVDGQPLRSEDIAPETRIFPKSDVSLVVTAPGFLERRISVRMASATRHEVIPIDLTSAAAREAPSPRSVPTERHPTETKNGFRWYHAAELGAAALGAVAIGYAVVTGLDYDATERRLRRDHDAINSDAEHCDSKTPECVSLRRERNGLEAQYDDNEGRVPLWVTAGAGGAVLLAAGLTLFFLSPPWSNRSAATTVVAVAPAVRSEGGQLVLVGRF